MFIDVLRILLFVVFTLSSLLLILVILLQEGKGGGLAAAFGGAGGETFGVGAGGINRFTAILAAIFIGSAVILAATADVDRGAPDRPANQVPE
jgi:preprotein translocase subunit SecG